MMNHMQGIPGAGQALVNPVGKAAAATMTFAAKATAISGIGGQVVLAGAVAAAMPGVAGTGSGRLARAANLAAGIASTRTSTQLSAARSADITSIVDHHLKNETKPDDYVAWLQRNFALEEFEKLYLRSLEATVFGEHGLRIESAGLTYLKKLFCWFYEMVQLVTEGRWLCGCEGRMGSVLPLPPHRTVSLRGVSSICVITRVWHVVVGLRHGCPGLIVRANC
jgi:hypothetical protein